jgi:glycosyltransferase involved in cell wall biosynthesis
MVENDKERPLAVFHHPGPVAPNGRAGSQVRPWQLLQAFREEGYDVVPVVGHGAERRQQIEAVYHALSSGRRISFVYSESRSIPTLLTEPYRIPRFPLMDFRFLRAMREAKVPVGLFYRDVFWRFDMYRTMLSWPGRAMTIPLYWYDWWWYQRAVDHLFLPSQGMAAHLPTPWPTERLSALPPGIRSLNIAGSTESPRRAEPLQFLYVGGVRPPTYDLTPLLATVRGLPGVRLTLCCRPEEWEAVGPRYAAWINNPVNIVHRTGEELRELYAEADLFALLREPHGYLDFAVPVKLFESVGYGLPILTLAGTEAARMVDQYELGWVVGDTASIRPLVEKLRGNPSLLTEKRLAVSRVQDQHSWGARVREIVRTLGRYGPPVS